MPARPPVSLQMPSITTLRSAVDAILTTVASATVNAIQQLMDDGRAVGRYAVQESLDDAAARSQCQYKTG
jgi:hypothetical protein